MIPVAVESGRSALDLLESGASFDIALLDLHMPEMDGTMLAAHIRRLRSPSELPLALLSSGAATRAEVCADGSAKDLFAFILSKPVKPSLLFDGMQTAVTQTAAPPRIKEPARDFDHKLADRLPLKILIAEDNVVNQRVLSRCLERIGYRPDIVANGLEAVEAVERQHYDAVLMDVHMPQMDGLEAAQTIRQRFRDKLRPRLIAMTANAMQGDREECLAAGMDDYVTKPVQMALLHAALERCAVALVE